MQKNVGRRIAILGAGIGGLTTALAFARTGADVIVYEQSDALTEVGAGLQITPNGARVLNALGLTDALATVGVAAVAVCPVDALSGRPITRFDLSAQSPDYRFYHRADLLGVLADGCRAAGVDIQLGCRIDTVSSDGRFVANGQTVVPALTIGADGLHSHTRPLLNGPGKPFFTKQIAWRALVQRDTAEPIAQIWMAPRQHVVTYPLRDGLLNVVAVQEQSNWADEGWHHKDAPANLQAAFADVGEDLQAILADVTDVRLWGLFRHSVAEHWQQDGVLALIGDAAHPTLPFLAQGANLAIEDGLALAACCQHDASLEHALIKYQETRRPRVTKAIDAANANARNYHLDGIKRRVAHTGLGVLGHVAPNAFLKRLGWLYDFDAPKTYRFAQV
jgi:salicylate hydroxylase